jgi:hypothetical protein
MLTVLLMICANQETLAASGRMQIKLSTRSISIPAGESASLNAAVIGNQNPGVRPVFQVSSSTPGLIVVASELNETTVNISIAVNRTVKPKRTSVTVRARAGKRTAIVKLVVIVQPALRPGASASTKPISSTASSGSPTSNPPPLAGGASTVPSTSTPSPTSVTTPTTGTTSTTVAPSDPGFDISQLPPLNYYEIGPGETGRFVISTNVRDGSIAQYAIDGLPSGLTMTQADYNKLYQSWNVAATPSLAIGVYQVMVTATGANGAKRKLNISVKVARFGTYTIGKPRPVRVVPGGTFNFEIPLEQTGGIERTFVPSASWEGSNDPLIKEGTVMTAYRTFAITVPSETRAKTAKRIDWWLTPLSGNSAPNPFAFQVIVTRQPLVELAGPWEIQVKVGDTVVIPFRYVPTEGVAAPTYELTVSPKVILGSVRITSGVGDLNGTIEFKTEAPAASQNYSISLVAVSGGQRSAMIGWLVKSRS